jgi:metallophosphoesterase (TIGR00282 family)
MSEKFKILFLGDITGRAGRNAVQKFLNKKRKYDFVIANVENASHGFGLTRKNHDEIASFGVDCMTSGNHIWDKKDVFQFIDESEFLIRPLNYHKSAPGTGYKIFNDKIAIVNLLGRVFMTPVDCPFVALEKIVKKIGKNKIIIVDFHAEATAEKISFAKFASTLGVSAVLGTHTHVQTADEKIMDEKCACITDVGFCGSYKGVIGMEYEGSLKHLITGLPQRFEVVEKPESLQINAVEITFDADTNRALDIKRINKIVEAKP